MFVTIGMVLVLAAGPAGSHADEREVREALLDANLLWVDVAQSLESERLAERFSGEALLSLEELLQMGRDAGMWVAYEVPVIEVESLELDIENGSAAAWVSETWASAAHSVESGECVWRLAANTIRQHYRLRVMSGVWKVEEIVADASNERPARLTCN